MQIGLNIGKRLDSTSFPPFPLKTKNFYKEKP
jgi:hypothetical protein